MEGEIEGNCFKCGFQYEKESKMYWKIIRGRFGRGEQVSWDVRCEEVERGRGH
jgi:hypothetical protein